MSRSLTDTTLTDISTRSLTRRSGARRAGERAFGFLLLTRLVLTGLVALLIVVAGAWSAWQAMPDALAAEGRQTGTMTVEVCDQDACAGTLAPAGRDVVLEQTIGREAGEELAVAVRPGTDEVVRTGFAGVMYAALPLAGALLLASLVIAGGLRMYRTAWAVAGIGAAALAVTFAAW